MKTPKLLALLAMSATHVTAGTASAPTGKMSAPIPTGSPCGGPINYNSAEINYLHTFFKGDGASDANGAGIDFTYSPFQNIYLTAGGSWTTLDIADVSVDQWGVLLGVGGYVPLAENFHLAMDGGVIFSGSDLDNFDNNDTCWYVRPHVRAKFGCFEVHAGAKLIACDGDNNWEGFGVGYYQVAPNVDLTAGVIWNEYAATVNGGVRFRF